jgi:hypothetical protein
VTQRLLGQLAAERGELVPALQHFEAAAVAAVAGGVARFGDEMRLFGALVTAALGDVDAALVTLRAVYDSSSEGGADLTALWASTLEGHLLLATDPAEAVRVAERAVAAAWETDYPACHVVNLHTLAASAVLRGDLREAAALTTEALEIVLSRGVLSETRAVLRLAAVVLHRAGVPGWSELAATVAGAPRVSVLDVPAVDVLPLPVSDHEPLTRRDAALRARAELEAVASAAPSLPPQRPASSSEAALVRRGDFWEIQYAGRSVTVKASKGMADLARLVRRPGHEVHCNDLAGVAVEQRTTGELVDGEARRAYESRLRDLQAEIDEAAADHDAARAELARSEFDAIVDHLSSAMGLRGGRRTGDTAERARTAVTQRLRGTIRRIASLHPELGRHLQASVSTGLYCCYRPEQPVRWSVTDATKPGTEGTSTPPAPAPTGPARHA